MMEWAEVVGTWALAAMVELGIPVVVLFGLGYYLYRRGHRWSPLLEGRGVSGRGVTVRLVRCWDMQRCPPEVRERCPAFLRPDMPCWKALKLAQGGRIQGKCLGCRLLLSR